MLSRVYFVSISGTIISEIRGAREINVSEEYKNVSNLVKKKRKIVSIVEFIAKLYF